MASKFKIKKMLQVGSPIILFEPLRAKLFFAWNRIASNIIFNTSRHIIFSMLIELIQNHQLHFLNLDCFLSLPISHTKFGAVEKFHNGE